MTNTNKPSEGAGSLVYQCRLPLSTNTVNYVADLLRAHLKAIGSRWRSRSADQLAVLVLAVLRHDQRAADLAGGNDISATTIRRWCDEVIALLAAKAPRSSASVCTSCAVSFSPGRLVCWRSAAWTAVSAS
ncbi:hypothetical protein [Streptomyces sp. NPDC000994]